MATHKGARLAEMIEEAEELAERFPDLPNHEVLGHVLYVTKRVPLEEDRLAILEAYQRVSARFSIDPA